MVNTSKATHGPTVALSPPKKVPALLVSLAALPVIPG